MRNHLFIGLGGQGGRSLAELRKVMAQRHRDVERLTGRGVKWDFLSIDSSQDVWQARKDWMHFGEDLQLHPNQKIHLSPMHLADDVRGLTLKPDVKPWLGDPTVIRGFVEGNAGIPGANQRRRFGRLLFWKSAAQIRHEIVSKKVPALTNVNVNSCCFHVFASVAGGTGSGGVVDLVAMLRHHYPDADPNSGFPIYLHLYATSNDGDSADVGYFYPNQFATLRDINALICGKLRPPLFGLGAGERFAGGTPVTAVFISSSLNRRNHRLPLATQLRIAAESTFERVFAVNEGNLSPESQKSLTFEDLIGAAPGEPLPGTERTYRFASAGMRRWEVPNEKIEELLSLDLQKFSLRQMLFNNWQEAEGFAARPQPLGNQASGALVGSLFDIVDAALLQRNRGAASREQLGQELDQLARGASAEGDALETIEGTMRQYFDQSFAEMGVERFFLEDAARRKGLVADIHEAADQELTRAWLSPVEPWALAHLIEVIDELELRIRGMMKPVEAADPVPKLHQRCQARRREWLKITALSRPFKARTLLLAHAADLRQECLARFDNRCREEDRLLLAALVDDVKVLRNAYALTRAEFERRLQKAESDDASLASDLSALHTQDDANVYEFDRAALKEFREVLQLREVELRRVSDDLRKHLASDQPGGTLAIGGKMEPARRERIDEKMQATALTHARHLHAELVEAGHAPRVLGESLLDRLQARVDPQTLDREVASFIERAASSCLIQEGQTQPREFDAQMPCSMPRRLFLLGIPQHPFAGQIRTAFHRAVPGGQDYVHDVYEHGDPSQIRLLIVDYWMAARFLRVGHELRTKYGAAVAGVGNSSVAYFCNIDSDGEQNKRSDILLPTPAEMKAKLEAELWVGTRLEPPCIVANQSGVYLSVETENGTRDERLGDTPEQVLEQADIPAMFKVAGAVNQRLLRLNDEQRQRLRGLVEAEEKRINEQFQPGSPQRAKWQTLRQPLNRLLT